MIHQLVAFRLHWRNANTMLTLDHDEYDYWGVTMVMSILLNAVTVL